MAGIVVTVVAVEVVVAGLVAMVVAVEVVVVGLVAMVVAVEVVVVVSDIFKMDFIKSSIDILLSVVEAYA